MALHRINKGLRLPLSGAPEQLIHDAARPTRVAIIAADYVGMKPRMAIQEGDVVKRGQLLFEDRKTPGVRFTAPGAGKIIAINRGERRALQSVVIELSKSEQSGAPDPSELEAFAAYTGGKVGELSREQVVALLAESGLWTSLRARPFSRVPSPESQPGAVFVTAIDTQPHAASVDKVLEDRMDDFRAGLGIVSMLTSGPTYLCVEEGSKVGQGPLPSTVKVEQFAGKHPAGNAGVHIHRLYPVGRQRVAWHLGYQDVVAMGRLFATGRLEVERIVALAGPSVKQPRLLRSRLGASLDELVAGDLVAGEQRVISGSVLAGRTAAGEVHGYLGRYHNQVSVLAEGREREFLGWLGLGKDKFSMIPVYLGRLFAGARGLSMTTTTHGSPRAMVPIGMYERVMPMDIMPTFLLRALLVGDLERAEQLGALELDEEDLALCTFVCPGKYDYGTVLRRNLTRIEKEG